MLADWTWTLFPTAPVIWKRGLVIGRAADADFVVSAPGVSRYHVRVARTCDGAFYVEDLRSTNGTFIGAKRVGISFLHGEEVLQLGPELLVRFALVDAREESLYQRLYDSSVYDPLTKVFNRKYLADRLFAEVSQARRAGGELALLMADIDGLKQVNDVFGHIAGDRLLCAIAAAIKNAIRAGDVLARYGGDEFAILAPGTGHLDAPQLGERVRQAVEALNEAFQTSATTRP